MGEDLKDTFLKFREHGVFRFSPTVVSPMNCSPLNVSGSQTQADHVQSSSTAGGKQKSNLIINMGGEALSFHMAGGFAMQNNTNIFNLPTAPPANVIFPSTTGPFIATGDGRRGEVRTAWEGDVKESVVFENAEKTLIKPFLDSFNASGSTINNKEGYNFSNLGTSDESYESDFESESVENTKKSDEEKAAKSEELVTQAPKQEEMKQQKQQPLIEEVTEVEVPPVTSAPLSQSLPVSKKEKVTVVEEGSVLSASSTSPTVYKTPERTTSSPSKSPEVPRSRNLKLLIGQRVELNTMKEVNTEDPDWTVCTENDERGGPENWVMCARSSLLPPDFKSEEWVFCD